MPAGPAITVKVDAGTLDGWEDFKVTDDSMVIYTFVWDGSAVIQDSAIFTPPAMIADFNAMILKPDGSLVLTLEENGSDYVSYEIMAEFN